MLVVAHSNLPQFYCRKNISSIVNCSIIFYIHKTAIQFVC